MQGEYKRVSSSGGGSTASYVEYRRATSSSGGSTGANYGEYRAASTGNVREYKMVSGGAGINADEYKASSVGEYRIVSSGGAGEYKAISTSGSSSTTASYGPSGIQTSGSTASSYGDTPASLYNYTNATPSSSFQYVKDLNSSQVGAFESSFSSSSKRTQYGQQQQQQSWTQGHHHHQSVPTTPTASSTPTSASGMSSWGSSSSLSSSSRPSSMRSDQQQGPATQQNEVRVRASAWAWSEGFTKDQMTEFDHLMGMISTTHIYKQQLSGMTEIDRGSFGKIFVSRYNGEAVAVKQLGSGGPCTLKSKMREILLELRVLVRIEHPNVVKFHGTATDFNVATTGRQPYVGLVFEFCGRGSLHKALFEGQRRLSSGQKLTICAQMSKGLAYLHSKRIIHRDLNTRNILLSNDLTAKIADFGCARVMSSTSKVLKTTTISGSPAYMAPEQMTGEPLTEAVDVWALAIMLWEVMMDTKPWEGRYTDFGHLKQAILRGEKLHMPASCHPYPPCFINAIKLGMQTRAHDRPNMALMARELASANNQFNRTTAC